MLNSVFGYLFLFVGFFILVLPLILVELSRPRDWLIGSLCSFLGLFLLVENNFLRGSLNLLVIAMSVLYGIMMSEIIRNRFNQLSDEEKKALSTSERWLVSLKQLGKIVSSVGNGVAMFFKSTFKNEKPQADKKWVRPELKEERDKKVTDAFDATDSNKLLNQELTENEETS